MKLIFHLIFYMKSEKKYNPALNRTGLSPRRLALCYAARRCAVDQRQNGQGCSGAEQESCTTNIDERHSS
jgi:hypothetical protein